MTNAVADGQASDSLLQAKLSTTKFIKNGGPHLAVRDQGTCHSCILRPCENVCPAGTYCYAEDEGLAVAHENCLECGSCKIVCEFDNIDWNYPPGGHGVDYHQG
ncbi:ferredoxin family protein [Candidatus Hydrogenedentota bacterium]